MENLMLQIFCHNRKSKQGRKLYVFPIELAGLDYPEDV